MKGDRYCNCMMLIPRVLEDVSEVKVSFFTTRLTTDTAQNGEGIVVIAFASERNVNRADLSFMNGMKLAAAQVWHPVAIVLDFRKLRYVWGDTMHSLFCSPYPVNALQEIFSGGANKRFPIVAVFSAYNIEGLTSLVQKEMSMEPSHILFGSIDEAVAAVEAELK